MTATSVRGEWPTLTWINCARQGSLFFFRINNLRQGSQIVLICLHRLDYTSLALGTYVSCRHGLAHSTFF